ncbi:MAG TPA: Na(+)-translocating NADH-quinone reductase subunit C [Oligoflexia bacterium]|nr:Na(+)-translocating NADH-quinone reductase subunit C [Oligoflexia bacterium]HMR24207.1 Na(+)-translocating NADH-quinone reductase subunit C [Oligoflexia bacterium]
MNNDSIKKTLIVSLTLCIVCSILVSGSAVLLRDKQERNKALDKKKNILVTAGLVDKNADPETINSVFSSSIEPLIYNFEEQNLSTEVPEGYDQRKAANDPQRSSKIEQDYANIKTRANQGLIYFVKKDGTIKQVILPIHGKGLWSTLYGFISLDTDLNTVKGISFYEHKETPGLGGEVDNPQWQAKWQGKVIYNENGKPTIEVIKGQVESTTTNANYKVDGLSGATITSRGVSNMLKYWFGEEAYGPLLKSLDLKKFNDQSLSQNNSSTPEQGATDVN